MERVLYVTESIPEQATILVVDVQEHYFQEVEVSEVVEQRIQSRLQTMKETLNQLKQRGHQIYAIVDEEGIHPTLEGITQHYLPGWAYKTNHYTSDPVERYILHPQITEALSTSSTVVVCGLWKELCVLSVTLLLQKEGITSYLSLDPALCLENALMWEDDDVITLEAECKDNGIDICSVNRLMV